MWHATEEKRLRRLLTSGQQARVPETLRARLDADVQARFAGAERAGARTSLPGILRRWQRSWHRPAPRPDGALAWMFLSGIALLLLASCSAPASVYAPGSAAHPPGTRYVGAFWAVVWPCFVVWLLSVLAWLASRGKSLWAPLVANAAAGLLGLRLAVDFGLSGNWRRAAFQLALAAVCLVPVLAEGLQALRRALGRCAQGDPPGTGPA